MQVAIALAAMFLGADMIIAGYTKRPISRLILGYWDAPGTNTPAVVPGSTKAPGNAMTGGVYAPTGPSAVYTGPGTVTVHGIQ